jgi:prephenate dehydrogenase
LRILLEPFSMSAMEIGIYGLGRFGTLWAALLADSFSVKAYSRNPDRPAPAGVKRVQKEEVCACDTVFLCVAISALEEVLEDIRGFVKPGAIVADTCSVKMYPIRMMKTLLPDTVAVLGTHPMFGPDSAKYGTKGLPIVMTPARGSERAVEIWTKPFEEMGLEVFTLTPQQHDKEAAYTQGVTHFIGRVLDDLSLKPSEIGTFGFGKLLEIIEQTCNDPWQLFLDLQRYNPYTKEMRIKLQKSLEKMLHTLEDTILLDSEKS